MPRSLTLCLAILVPGYLFSQKKDIPTFGKIDKMELENKACPYDPDAYRSKKMYTLLDEKIVIKKKA